jgi:hypothetical protein
MPGLVSTLLNQAYSMPSRLVQTFLQVMEQVWQPMHLSRFRTMPICERIFISVLLDISRQWARQIIAGGAIEPVDLAILRTTTNSSRLQPTVP